MRSRFFFLVVFVTLILTVIIIPGSYAASKESSKSKGKGTSFWRSFFPSFTSTSPSQQKTAVESLEESTIELSTGEEDENELDLLSDSLVYGPYRRVFDSFNRFIGVDQLMEFEHPNPFFALNNEEPYRYIFYDAKVHKFVESTYEPHRYAGRRVIPPEEENQYIKWIQEKVVETKESAQPTQIVSITPSPEESLKRLRLRHHSVSELPPTPPSTPTSSEGTDSSFSPSPTDLHSSPSDLPSSVPSSLDSLSSSGEMEPDSKQISGAIPETSSLPVSSFTMSNIAKPQPTPAFPSTDTTAPVTSSFVTSESQSLGEETSGDSIDEETHIHEGRQDITDRSTSDPELLTEIKGVEKEAETISENPETGTTLAPMPEASSTVQETESSETEERDRSVVEADTNIQETLPPYPSTTVSTSEATLLTQFEQPQPEGSEDVGTSTMQSPDTLSSVGSPSMTSSSPEPTEIRDTSVSETLESAPILSTDVQTDLKSVESDTSSSSPETDFSSSPLLVSPPTDTIPIDTRVDTPIPTATGTETATEVESLSDSVTPTSEPQTGPLEPSISKPTSASTSTSASNRFLTFFQTILTYIKSFLPKGLFSKKCSFCNRLLPYLRHILKGPLRPVGLLILCFISFYFVKTITNHLPLSSITYVLFLAFLVKRLIHLYTKGSI